MNGLAPTLPDTTPAGWVNPDADPSRQPDRSGVGGCFSVGDATFSVAFLLVVLVTFLAPVYYLRWAGELLEHHHAGYLVALAPLLLAGITFLGGARWSVFLVLGQVEYRRQRRRPQRKDFRQPLVSIFVPSFNEEATMDAAMRSMINLDYPRYEIVVVDDGSTDDTYRLAKAFEGEHDRCTVRVYTKPNGGKWTALNFAYQHSRGELVLCVDADSRLTGDTLRLMVDRMADPRLDALSGQVRVRNRQHGITRLQAFEYVLANGALRMAQAHSGTVLVVPGPIGMYRRHVLEEVLLRWGCSGEGADASLEQEGPVSGDTFAEDFDLSLAVLALGGRIGYEPRAISNTEAPADTATLLNQRYRWSRGTMQVLWKFLKRCRKDRSLRHPRLMLWLTATYFTELFLLPITFFFGVAATCGYLVAGGSAFTMLASVLPLMTVPLALGTHFIVQHQDRFNVLRVIPLYDFYQGILVNSSWAIALVDELRGCRMRWS